MLDCCKNMNNQKGFILPIIIAVIVVAFLGMGGYFVYKQYSVPERPEQVVCAQDAKQCPDGTYVGRTGPNCEFAECPTAQQPANETAGPALSEVEGWKIYRTSQYGFEIKYPNLSKGPSQILGGVMLTPLGSIGDLFIKKLIKEPTNNRFDNSVLSNNTTECIIGASDGDIKDFYSYKSLKNINNITLYRYINYPDFIGGFCGMSGGCQYKDIYRTLSETGCYEIEYTRSDRVTVNPTKVPEIIDQIISTFKFTK